MDDIPEIFFSAYVLGQLQILDSLKCEQERHDRVGFLLEILSHHILDESPEFVGNFEIELYGENCKAQTSGEVQGTLFDDWVGMDRVIHDGENQNEKL